MIGFTECPDYLDLWLRGAWIPSYVFWRLRNEVRLAKTLVQARRDTGLV